MDEPDLTAPPVEAVETPAAPAVEAPAPVVEEKPKQDFVPHQALHEQREITKALKAELAETRARSEKMEETFQKLLSSINEKPQPKFEEDPLGYMQAKNNDLEKKLGSIDEKLGNFDKEAKETAQIQHIVAQIQHSEAEVRQAKADYDQAVKHMKDVRREDMRDAGVPVDQIERILTQEILAFSQTAISQGKNPAEAAYKMAVRYGYKPQEKQANKLEVIAAGQEAAKTVNGSGSGGGLSLRDLSQLPDSEFDKIINDPKKWDALIRGQTIQ